MTADPDLPDPDLPDPDLPDPDLPDPGPDRWDGARVLAAVFAGGVLGGSARYAVTLAWPTPPGGFPWGVLTVNTTGALGLALLLVVLAEVRPAQRYLRPLLGTGLLGAFTTFSAVAAGADQLVAHGSAGVAAAYLTVSVLAAPVAVGCGLLLGRAVTGGPGAGRRTGP